jgi:hypothetical protein
MWRYGEITREVLNPYGVYSALREVMAHLLTGTLEADTMKTLRLADSTA